MRSLLPQPGGFEGALAGREDLSLTGGASSDAWSWTTPYGVATKFWVLEVAGPVVPLPEPTAKLANCQIWFAVDGSGVAAA